MKNTDELRDFLIEEMRRLRNKETTHQDAQAIGKLAAQVINSLNVDLEFAKHVSKCSEHIASARLIGSDV